MDRALRFTLFALCAFAGGLVTILVSQSRDEPQAQVVPIADEPEEELDWDQLAIREREQGEQRAEVIRAAAAREPVDPEWAPITQRQIADRFAVHGPSGSTLISATCKTSLCIVEIETLSPAESGGLQRWHRFFGLSRGWVLPREPAQDGPSRSVIFLARDGHSLPG